MSYKNIASLVFALLWVLAASSFRLLFRLAVKWLLCVNIIIIFRNIISTYNNHLTAKQNDKRKLEAASTHKSAKAHGRGDRDPQLQMAILGVVWPIQKHWESLMRYMEQKGSSNP